MAIQSFKDRTTEAFFVSGTLKKTVPWRSIRSMVRRKLDMLHYASKLVDLSSPPSNRLEALKGNLAGCHSIRVNSQWRIVFEWSPAGVQNVRVDDYHF